MNMIHNQDWDVASNPLDIVEDIVNEHHWNYERRDDEGLYLSLTGSWGRYDLGFTYCDSLGALQVVCSYDVSVADDKLPGLYALLSLINERTWLGHFEIWTEQATPLFRHTVLLRDSDGPSRRLLEDLIEVALAECERFHPAFQFLLWDGKTASEAIEASLLDTVGEA